MSGSIFTLSFAIELANVEATQEGTDENILELQNYVDGYKITYDLYPGFSKELNIVVWPQCAKVLGADGISGWVRTWRHGDRSWIAFSVRHLVPARVREFAEYTVSVVPAGSAGLSSEARNIKSAEVSFPRLKFNERYNFGGVVDALEGETADRFISNTIWGYVVDHIPATKYDVVYDTPEPVTEIRHQDAIMGHVVQQALREPSGTTAVSKVFSKTDKKTEIKEKKAPDGKYELTASGDVIMAGVGRVTSLRASGAAPRELQGFGVFLSTSCLPTDDDLPIIFVNIDNLFQLPVEELVKARISHVYTRWQLDEEQHYSALRELSTTVSVDDHHVFVLTHDIGVTVTSGFLDKPFEVELRGIREETVPELRASLFSTMPKDKFKKTAPQPHEDFDVLIGLFQVDGEKIAKGFNTLIKGEFSVTPPAISYTAPRHELCSNDINSIGVEFKPMSCLPNYVLLESQMSLEVAMGFVGCRPHSATEQFSRLYILLENDEGINILQHVTSVNEALMDMDRRDDVLTGFAVDTGHCLFALIEGKKDGKILDTLELVLDLYPAARIVFSTVAKYSKKVFDDSIIGCVPFKEFKMSISLSLLVACPMLYVRPAVPLPARNALLKLHRLISRDLADVPTTDQLPTIHELRSFRLEFCAPPARVDVTAKSMPRDGKYGKITWEKGS